MSEHEPTIGDILALLTALGSNVSNIKAELVNIQTDLVNIRVEMATKADLVNIRAEMATQFELKNLYEFMQSSLSSKEDLHELESRIMTHIDGLVQDNRKLDQERLAMHNRQNRLEDRVERLELKTA